MVLSTGVVHGIGFTLVYAVAIGTAQKWFPEKARGFIGSLVLSGYGYGSSFWIPVETAFVNPDNVSPCSIGQDLASIGCNNLTDKYFIDPDLLDRVPDLFLLIGGIIAIFSIIGLLCLSDKDNVNERERQEDNSEVEELPSLTPMEIIKTPLFYKARLSFCKPSIRFLFRCGTDFSRWVQAW